VIDRDFLYLMDTGFCVSALETALARFGSPKIFNTDSQKIEASSRVVQGSKFTSTEFTGILAGAGIKISMDGKGRWMDKVFVARL
jgi:putative transposase